MQSKKQSARDKKMRIMAIVLAAVMVIPLIASAIAYLIA